MIKNHIYIFVCYLNFSVKCWIYCHLVQTILIKKRLDNKTLLTNDILLLIISKYHTCIAFQSRCNVFYFFLSPKKIAVTCLVEFLHISICKIMMKVTRRSAQVTWYYVMLAPPVTYRCRRFACADLEGDQEGSRPPPIAKFKFLSITL